MYLQSTKYTDELRLGTRIDYAEILTLTVVYCSTSIVSIRDGHAPA